MSELVAQKQMMADFKKAGAVEGDLK